MVVATHFVVLYDWPVSRIGLASLADANGLASGDMVIGKIIGLVVLSFAAASGAFGQVTQNEWTPWEEDPSCFVSETHFTTPDAKQLRPSAESMILRWYVWGDAFITNVDYRDLYDFSTCFAYEDCGLPKDPDIGNRLVSVFNSQGRERISADEPLAKYFSQPPPPEAIKFAARGVGRCFGAATENYTLEQLGFSRIDTPADVCLSVAVAINAGGPRSSKWSSQRNMDIQRYPGVKAWLRAINTLIQERAAQPSRQVEVCTYAPEGVAPILTGAAETTRAANQAAQTTAEAERIRLTNRTDEERFGGLNGCQIAYSLVFQGINSKTGTVGAVPDEAISWALAYEKANLAGEACPVMPTALSDWVQQQPMATFQAEPDPYASFRMRTGPSFGNDYDDWDFFAKTWMLRYETQPAAANRTGSDCDAVLYYARSDRFRPSNEDNAISAFATLARLSYKSEASRAMCGYAPVSMIPAARDYYDREVARQREAYEAEMRSRRPAVPAQPQQNYLWKSAPTTRCYWSGDSKYGQKNVCFTN